MAVPTAEYKEMDFVKSVVKKGLLTRSQEPMACERRMDELVGELEVERRNIKREKQAVARLQREVARHRGEGSMRERLMCDLESERRLRLESEKRLQEVTRELTQCRTQLRALRDQFERMEETVQDLMRGQSRVSPPAGKATPNGSSAQDVLSGPGSPPPPPLPPPAPPRSVDDVITELQTSAVVGDASFEEERKKIRALLERLQSLEAQNSALSLENESQRDQYERCLDEVANQVVQALLTQKDLREECLKLRTRVCDLEEQNRSMSILFQQKLRLPSEATLQAGVALGVVEGGPLCRGVGSVPTLGRRRHRLVTSSCSSSEISLSSTCSELSTHSCPWPAEQRDSAAGQKAEMRDGRHADKEHGKESAGSEKDRSSRAEEQRRSGNLELGALASSHEEALKRQQRKEMSILQGLRQLVSREPIPAPDDRASLRPGEWTTHRDLMSSNEGIYSPGSKQNDFPGVVAHASVRLRSVQPHQKCSYESDSQEESEDDARGAGLEPVPCKEWTLPSCLRLPHSLSDGLFGLGPRAPFPRTPPRCVYQVRGVDERIAGYLPRCQSLGKSPENWRFGLTADRAQLSLKGGEEPAGKRNGEGPKPRPARGPPGGAAFPSISVSLAQSVHKTVSGQVSSLCGQVISLTGQVTSAGERPRMLQFVKRAAVVPADAPVRPEEEPLGPVLIYDAKDCCPVQLGPGGQTSGAPALRVKGSAKHDVDYTELEPEASPAGRAADNNYAVLESPTEEQPIRDSDGSSAKAAPPVPTGSSTTGNVSQMNSGSTSAPSSHSQSAMPALALSHGAQQRLIKPPYGGGHKSNGLYSAGFAAACSPGGPGGPSGPRVLLGRMSGKSQSLPQQAKVPCKAGESGGGNPPAFRSKSQEKSGGSAPSHDKSPGPSSPAKLSRFLKMPSVGGGSVVKSDSGNPTRGSPQLPRSSRIPCKSEAAAAAKLPSGGGAASPAPEPAAPPGRKPVPAASLSRVAVLSPSAQACQQAAPPAAPCAAVAAAAPVLSPEHQEEPVRDGAAKPQPPHLVSPPPAPPPPPGRSASLLIKPNYDIPPSMTLLRPSYDAQQSLLRVRCKEQQPPPPLVSGARGAPSSRLPVGSPTHVSKLAGSTRVPQAAHKSQGSVSDGVGYSQTLAHASYHQQPRLIHGSLQQQQQQQQQQQMQQQKLQLPQSQSDGNMTQNQAILSPKKTVNNVTQHADATKSCLTMKSPAPIDSRNAVCGGGGAPERQNHAAAIAAVGFAASACSANGLNSPPVGSKREQASGQKDSKLERGHGDARETGDARTSVTPPSKEPERASDAASGASKGVPPCPQPSDDATSPATHGCGLADLGAKLVAGDGPPLASSGTSYGDAEFRDELKGLRSTPQSPGTARPYPKPALGMSGTKVRSQSFSAQPGSRERMPTASSAGELSPKIRTHIITNTAERGIPLSRQSSLTTPEPPRVSTPSEHQQPQQQQHDHATAELQLSVLVSEPHGAECAGENGYEVLEAVSESELLKHCAQNFHNVTIVQEAITAQPGAAALGPGAEERECVGAERGHGSPTKLPSRLPARAEREKAFAKPDGPRSPTRSERSDDPFPDDDGHGISPARAEGARSPGELEDLRARQRAPTQRTVPKFDIVRQPKERDGHRPAVSPDGHRAMSPDGRRVTSPDGHRAMSPEGHRAMSPEGHRAATRLEEQRNAANAKLPRAKLESPRAVPVMESVRLAQNVKTPKMHADVESSEGQKRVAAGEGECDGFSVNGKGLILQERDAGRGADAPGLRQLRFTGTRTCQQQQQQLCSPHYGAKSPTKSTPEPQQDSPRRLVQPLSPQGSAAGPSIEEKVMQGIQANMLRKEQQGASRTSAASAEAKPKSGAASSIASWFGFRRNKSAAAAAAAVTTTTAGSAAPGKKADAPAGDGKKPEAEKQESKKVADGKTDAAQRKEEKKEWAPLSRRLKPRGKRLDGKQPDKQAPDAHGNHSSPDGSARQAAHAGGGGGGGGGGLDGPAAAASSPSTGEFLQEILSRVEKRTMSPNRAPEDSVRKLDPTLCPPHHALLPPDKQPLASPVECDAYGLSLVGLLKGPGRGNEGELLGVWRQEEEEATALQLSDWSPKIPRRQPNHLGRVGEGGDGCEATLTLETALAGESARSHAAGFHCQMRTLDSGIGTFPPPDPSGRGVGRSSSRRGAKPESHNTLQQPHNALQFTHNAPSAGSPGSVRRAPPQQPPRAGFHPACQPAAPVRCQPGAPAGGGGGRGEGASGSAMKAKTLDRETAPGVGGGVGGCAGDGTERMSHSLSDPSMAARASRAAQSRLPKPVIAVPVKLPAASAVSALGAERDDDDDDDEEEEAAPRRGPPLLRSTRAPGLAGCGGPLGLQRLPLALPQEELALPDVFLTESSSSSSSEDESEEGGVVMPRPLGAPSTDIYAKLQRANRVVRKHLVLPPCAAPAPISVADAFHHDAFHHDAFHHGSYQRAPCRLYGERDRTTIVPFDLLMEGEEEEEEDEHEDGEGDDDGGQRAAASPDATSAAAAFLQRGRSERAGRAAPGLPLGPGVARSAPQGPATTPKDGSEGEEHATDDTSFASGKAAADNVESLSDSLYDSFSSTASQLSNEA